MEVVVMKVVMLRYRVALSLLAIAATLLGPSPALLQVQAGGTMNTLLAAATVAPNPTAATTAAATAAPPLATATATSTVTAPSTVTVDDAVQGSAPYEFNYIGSGWQHNLCSPRPNCYDGTISTDGVTDDYVTFAFTGTGITLYGTKALNAGHGAASIDGGSATDVDYYAPAVLDGQVVYVSPMLPYGYHTFKLRVTGQHDDPTNATATIIYVDRIDISGSPPPPTPLPTPTGTPPTATPSPSDTLVPTFTPTLTSTTTSAIGSPTPSATPLPSITPGPNGYPVVTIDDAVQGTGPYQFNYVGNGWTHYSCSPRQCYNSTLSEDGFVSDTVSISFTGTGVKLYGTQYLNGGIGAITIDGVSTGEADFFAPALLDDVVVYTSPTLSYGPHIFQMTVTTKHDANSTSTIVFPDRVDISGSPPPPTPLPTPTGTPPTATPSPSDTPVPTFIPTPTATPGTPPPTPTAGPHGYSVGIISRPGFDIYDYAHSKEPYNNYLYAPAIVINPDKSIDMWFCSQGDITQGSSDAIRYRHSTDGGRRWTPDAVALAPTPGSADTQSACDPSVVKYGNYYYLVYGSAAFIVYGDGYIFAARSLANPVTGNYDPTQPFEKWNGSGWGGAANSPVPIVTFTGNPCSYGVGQPSVTIVAGVLYLYYTYYENATPYTQACLLGNGPPVTAPQTAKAFKVQTRVQTAPIAQSPDVWPANLTYQGVAVNKAGAEDAFDVKYDDALGKFIALTEVNQQAYPQSFLKIYESTDGIHFTAAYYMNGDDQPGKNNMGLSGNQGGHLDPTDDNFVSYDYGDPSTPPAPIYRVRIEPIVRVFPVNSGAFSDDFSTGASAWLPDGGSWSLIASAYSQTNSAGSHVATANGVVFGDATYEADVRLGSTSSVSDGAGLTIAAVHPDDAFGASGYTALLQAGGAVALYKAGVGEVASSAPITGLDPTAGFVHLKVVKGEKDLQVYVNSAPTPQLDWLDQGTPFNAGFVSLTTDHSSASFKNVSVYNNRGDDFSHGAGSWTPKAGNWAVADGGYEQSDTTASPGYTTLTNAVFGEATYESDVKIITATTPLAAAGIALSETSPDAGPGSGYAAYLRANGDLYLTRAGQTVVTDVPTGLLPTKGLVHLAVVKREDATGTEIQVFAGDSSDPQISYEYTSTVDLGNGYTSLVTQGAGAVFGPVCVDTQSQPMTTTAPATCTSMTGLPGTPVPATATSPLATVSGTPGTSVTPGATGTGTTVAGTGTQTTVVGTVTGTSVPGTVTQTSIATSIGTIIPGTVTQTSVAGTATGTSIPGTVTGTQTSIPGTVTGTQTSIPTTSNTSVPAPATNTNTTTPVPSTATQTSVPGTVTGTSVAGTGTSISIPTIIATIINTGTSVPGTTTGTSVAGTVTQTTVVGTVTGTSVPGTVTQTSIATSIGTIIPGTVTQTSVAGTATGTQTSIPGTVTGTQTSIVTISNTSIPASATPMATPVPSATNTNTAMPPMATSTPVPPTSTNTPVLSATSTSTNTPVPPTNTSTNTPVPSVTNANTSAPSTSTATPVPSATSAAASAQAATQAPVQATVPPTLATEVATAVAPVPSLITGLPANSSHPAIALNPGTAAPGATVTVMGGGFVPGETVTLSLNGAALDTRPATVAANRAGHFQASFVVPDGLLSGANTVSAIGTRGGISTAATLIGRLSVASRFFLAGGQDGAGTIAQLQLLNPNGGSATARLTVYYTDGTVRRTTLTLPAHMQRTVSIAGLTGRAGQFGLALTATRQIAAQLKLTRPGRDGDAILANTGLGTRWYLAEGYTGLTFHETVAILNPSPSQPAYVALRLLALGGTGSRTVSLAVSAHSESVVDVSRLLAGRSLSVIATSDRGVVVERALTFSRDGRGTGYGLTTRAGTNVAATSWLFAEGTTVNHFETYLTILNPGAAPARVTARFYGRAGRLLGNRTITVAGLSRANIRLNGLVNASGIASTVMSDRPVIVERPEYFGSPNGTRVAGSVVFGRNGGAPRWSFAGGDTNGTSEFLLLYNPSPQAVPVTATFYGADGRTVERRLSIAARGRATLDVERSVPGLAGLHGVTLASDDGQGFVAEQTVFAPNLSTLNSTQGFAQ